MNKSKTFAVFALILVLALAVSAGPSIFSVYQGGTGLNAVAAHQVFVGTAANVFTAKTIPDCTDTTGNHLNYTQSTDAFSCGTSGSGGGGGGSGSGISYGGTYCTNSTTGSATSRNCASNYNVEASQLIIATAGFFAGNCTGTPAFADTLAGGLTWHQIGTACNATNHQMETAWWATPGASTGADTFTVSCPGCNDGSGSGGFGFMGMTVSEAIGASLSSPIDASTTLTGAGLQSFDLTGYSSTADLIFLAFQNSGTVVLDPNMFTVLNDNFEANTVQHAQLGPYHMRPSLGSNGAGVAFAIH